MDQVADEFWDNGFVVLKNVLPTEAIEPLRNNLMLLSRDRAVLSTDIYSKAKDLRPILYINKTLLVLEEILRSRPIYHCKTASAQFDKWSPWHKDTTGQAASGCNYHLEDGFDMVQVAFYLQPGSLDVIPGTHRDTVDPHVDKEMTYDRFYRIYNNPTDAIIFHVNLTHRGTPNTSSPKMVILQSFTSKKKWADAYLDDCIKHSREYKYDYLINHKYDNEFIEEANSKGIIL